MAEPDHLALLRQGVDVWNAWREKEPLVRPDLIGANLSDANLSVANLSRVNLRDANLSAANLNRANLFEADLLKANLSDANLNAANLNGANVSVANLSRADLSGATLVMAHFTVANLSGANLNRAMLRRTDFSAAKLCAANLSDADLIGASLVQASLVGANLSGANLIGASLVGANLDDADLTGCLIYGISAWSVKLNERTKQQGLVITASGDQVVTVDDLEVAQFVYLLLHNEKIRRVIDTIGKKGVLLLGRFTEGRIVVLDRLREELRERGYLPIVFNFDKPETKDFTETVRLLAGLSKFVIADITNPKSAPLELQATVPEIMVPFRPIIEEGEKPFAMLQDLWIKHREWMFEPIHYSSVDALIASLDEKIIRPAEARFAELLARKAETMRGEHV